MSNLEMEHQDNSENVHRLMEELCEGDCRESRQQQLANILRSSPSARRLYVRFLSLHFWLQLRFNRYKDSLHESELSELFATGVEQRTAWHRLRSWKVSLAIAASLLLLLPAVVWFLDASEGEKLVTAELPLAAIVQGVHQCQWHEQSEAKGVGQIVREGDRLRLEAGLAELRFDSGATAIIEGPADLTISNSRTCSLPLGKLVAKVDDRGTGFTVETDSARVVDVGTEFGLRRNSRRELHVAVFQGEVQVFANSVQRGPTSQSMLGNVVGGESANVYSNGGNRLSFEKEDRLSKEQFSRELPKEADRGWESSGLVATDGFATAEGGQDLVGDNSGIGWNHPWQDETVELTTTKLVSFADSATLRGQGAAAVHRRLPTSLGDSEPLYVSARFRIDGPDTICTAWVLLFEEMQQTGGGEAGLMAFGISDRRFSARLAPREGDLAVNPNPKRLGDFGEYLPGVSHLLVAKLEFDAVGDKERLSLWIDPVADLDHSIASPDHVVQYDTGKRAVDMVALRFWEMDGQTKGYIDDLRIGTTWEAVVR